MYIVVKNNLYDIRTSIYNFVLGPVKLRKDPDKICIYIHYKNMYVCI
jgi:hypothetical protein